jgi:hypothetical protein
MDSGQTTAGLTGELKLMGGLRQLNDAEQELGTSVHVDAGLARSLTLVSLDNFSYLANSAVVATDRVLFRALGRIPALTLSRHLT